MNARGRRCTIGRSRICPGDPAPWTFSRCPTPAPPRGDPCPCGAGRRRRACAPERRNRRLPDLRPALCGDGEWPCAAAGALAVGGAGPGLRAGAGGPGPCLGAAVRRPLGRSPARLARRRPRRLLRPPPFRGAADGLLLPRLRRARIGPAAAGGLRGDLAGARAGGAAAGAADAAGRRGGAALASRRPPAGRGDRRRLAPGAGGRAAAAASVVAQRRLAEAESVVRGRPRPRDPRPGRGGAAMTAETPLDAAFLAQEADPDPALRLRFHERVLDAELAVALDEAAEGDALRPSVYDLEDGRFVLAFDRDERLADFFGMPTAFAVLTGRRLAAMLAGQGTGIALNLGAPSATLLPAAAVDWLAAMVQPAPEVSRGSPCGTRLAGRGARRAAGRARGQARSDERRRRGRAPRLRG